MTTIRTRRTPPVALGPMLANARLRARLRLREAARLIGIGHQYLLRLETGQRVPSRSVAEAVADVLRLDDDERAQLLAAALEDAGRDSPKRSIPGSPIGNRSGAHGHHSDY
ncbi:helix-turn-helix domain-containing protein [Streptomyces sp. NPDC008139]|uniref:helix-turn-helix domain-containing protein n=1 Tax=Streptomyces sp. NPDC008139 TaxID=3364814 RepID=UPI0036E17EDD